MIRICLALILMISPAVAHDNWISRDSLRNKNGEWCCGNLDCKTYTSAKSMAFGWMLDEEFIPYDEAMPIVPPDGEITICRRPDGSRRCVFGIKPGL